MARHRFLSSRSDDWQPRPVGSLDRPLALALALAALAAAFLAGTACGGRKPSGPPPQSLLLVTIDTLRADHVSCYGPSPARTPALDGLASRGALVERAWATVPLTTASHASILTGLYPPSHGIRNNSRFRLPDDVETLAESLKARGLRTAAFVASFTVARLFGLDQGFDLYDDDLGHNPDGTRRQQRPADEVVRNATEWLSANAGAPFFLWVHLFDPHSPYEPPAAFRAAYPNDPYSGEVAFADSQLGVLLQALDRSGAAGRTAIAVLADHGEGLGTHGEMDHGFLLYEETVRVPFILVAEGRIRPGTRIRQVASTVDLVPTVLGLLEAPLPGGVQGRDLLAAGRGGGAHTVYAETLYPHEELGWSALYALRRGDIKYIESPRPELYDLAADPQESRDLSGPRVKELQAMAADLRDLAGRIVDAERLAKAAGLGSALDPETLEQLESLGYLGGGAATSAAAAEALPAVGGRNPRDAVEDLELLNVAQRRLHARDHAGALAILRELEPRDPDNPQLLLKLALALDGAGEIEEARRRLEAVVERFPTFLVAYRAYTDLLERRGEAEKSRELWLRLAARVPGYVSVPVRIAQAELAARMPREAVARLEAYLREQPADAEGWAYLGRGLAELGDRDGALEAHRRALEIQPTQRIAVEEAVNILLMARQPDEARRLVAGLLRQVPADPVLRKVDELLRER